MSQETTTDLLQYDENGKVKMPSGLNVLTILTFIGCAIFGLFTLFTPMLMKFSKGTIEKALTSGQELTAKQMEDMRKGLASIELTQSNLIPLMVIGIVGISLCLIGAIWMRKYKKDGYWMYVAGELAPVIGSFLIMGTAQYTSIWSVLFGVGVPIVFVLLYTMQRKYLTK